MPKRKRDKKRVRVLIAAGGTGGHVYPALAIGEEIRARYKKADVRFVGSHRGMESKILPRTGMPFYMLKISGLRGLKLRRKLRTLLRLPIAVWHAWRLMGAMKPDLVLGFGGYASGPVMIAAILRRRPRIVFEQNTVPGMTNRVAGKLAQRIVVAFPMAAEYFAQGKVQVMGNPLRREFDADAPPQPKGEGAFRLLAFGGSQGSKKVNNELMEAYPTLQERIPKLELVHQCGGYDFYRVEAHYKESGGLPHELTTFIEDMAGHYKAADLAICRAGATSLAELVRMRCPAIVVPFAASAGDHQVLNAQSMADTGAVIMITEHELTPEKLIETVTDLANHPERLRKMREALANLDTGDATARIVEMLDSMLPEAKRRGAGRAVEVHSGASRDALDDTREETA